MPCTPAGIQALFVHYDIDVSGKHVGVIGRGPTLGRPLSLLLTTKAPGANAAVTVVHSAVPDLADLTREADIVVAALGVPSFVQPDMVKPGAVVVSGGISWEGRKLLADVDESVGEVASWITPRLGGVGPTTVAMLLHRVRYGIYLGFTTHEFALASPEQTTSLVDDAIDILDSNFDRALALITGDGQRLLDEYRVLKKTQTEIDPETEAAVREVA